MYPVEILKDLYYASKENNPEKYIHNFKGSTSVTGFGGKTALILFFDKWEIKLKGKLVYHVEYNIFYYEIKLPTWDELFDFLVDLELTSGRLNGYYKEE